MKNKWIILVVSFLMFIPSMSVAQGLDACNLITMEQAQKAAGVKVAEGKLTDMEEASGISLMAGKTLCHFESLDAEHYRRFVSVDLTVKKSHAEAMEAFNDMAAFISSPEHVTGIGDKAVWSEEIKSPFGELHVVSGSYVLIIKINSGKEKNNLKQAKNLAMIALKKL